jgi:hypothetical protein
VRRGEREEQGNREMEMGEKGIEMKCKREATRTTRVNETKKKKVKKTNTTP